MGEQVAKLGKSYFRSEFWKNSMRPKQTAEDKIKCERIRNIPKWRHFLHLALFACLVVLGIVFTPIIIPITVFIVMMYFGSLGIAVLKYDSWLSRCLSRYQASQRGGGKSTPSRVAPQPLAPNPITVLFQKYEEVDATHRVLDTVENFTMDDAPLATMLHRFEFKLGDRILTMVVEVWHGRIHTVIFSNADGEDIDDEEAAKLLKANSGGVTWVIDKTQPRYLLRSDKKAFASYENGRQSLHLVGRELLSARATALKASRSR